MNYDYTDFEMDTEFHEEESYTFTLKEDAIYCLFEELYDSAYDINREAIHDALRFLMYKEGMYKALEEFKDYRPEEICVKHKTKI